MLTFAKSYGIWIAAAALLATAFGWYKSELRAAEYRGQAMLMADSAKAGFDRLVDSTEAWAARKAASDSARAALASELEDQRGIVRVAREGAAQTVLAARARIRTLHDSIQTLTAEDVAAIGAAMDDLEESATTCITALGTCEELVTAADARIWDLEEQARQSLDLNRNQAVTIERFQNMGRPKIGTVGYLGWLVAAVELVAIVVM